VSCSVLESKGERKARWDSFPIIRANSQENDIPRYLIAKTPKKWKLSVTFSLDNNLEKFVLRFRKVNKQRRIRVIKIREFKTAKLRRNFLLVYHEARRKLIT